MNELHWSSVVELSRDIARKAISPVEIVDALLRRIEQHDGKLKSFLAVFAEQARAEAKASEAAVRTGQRLGPLHGVPVAVKDLYDMQGCPTTAGWNLPTLPAARDCTVVARLRAAGAIILGKNNLHPFAYGPEGLNPLHGTSWNPWSSDVARMPGGSSSGSGVAVAAGLVPMSMGSDTGGSIRIPAACCGTVGLKPTYGRVSREGIAPLAWSMDHAGPLTRSVADAAAILGVIAGHDPADPSSSSQPVPDYLGGLQHSVRDLQIGLLADFIQQTEPQVQHALAEAVAVLQGLGCTITEVALKTAPHSLGATYALIATEAFAYHEPLLKKYAGQYPEDVRRRLLAGSFLTGADYLRGQRARQVIRTEIDTVLQGVTCLLAPTLPFAAPPCDATEVRLGGRLENARGALTMFTRLFNVSGHPVLALPCGFSSEGLPLSLQFVGRPFDEATLLRLGHAYEQATEWHQRRPPGY